MKGINVSKKIIGIGLVLVLAACGGGQSSQEMTAQALGESISLTATAAALGGFSSVENLQTAQAEATQKADDAAATQAAAAGLSAEAQAAIAAAEAPILAQLPTYGVNPSQGKVAWIHPPETLSVEGFMQFDYVNRFIGTVATNFVVSADITWNTSYGTAGCGFVLRSDGNKEAGLSQYLAIATRGGNGRVIFGSMELGEFKNAIDHYAYGIDPLFDWQNDATNRITIVARDETFTIYTNGTKLGEVVAGKAPVLVLPAPPVEPPAGASAADEEKFQADLAEHADVVAQAKANYQTNLALFQPDTPYFERGFVAMVALSESGTTTCTFNNAWLFVMDN